MTIDRRTFLTTSATLTGGLLVPRWVAAAYEAKLPTDDPASGFLKGIASGIPWTAAIRWDNVVDATKAPGDDWDTRCQNAQTQVAEAGGGVVYFPPGIYAFRDFLRLKDGVVIRGAAPGSVTDARSEKYTLGTTFEFPKYKPSFKGDGTPIDSAFKGIVLENPGGGKHTGLVHVDVNRGHVHFTEGEEHACGGHRLVVGCILRNCAVADPEVPDPKYKQHAWQRFTSRHHAAVDVQGENLLVANNRLPESGDENFTQKGYVLAPFRGQPDQFDVVFDYDNRPGLYVNHWCVGGPGGSGNDGTPESHPYGFRTGIVIRDNHVFNSGRMGIGFSGDGVVCRENVIRIPPNVFRPTVTGHKRTTGSSTNDNRAIEMRGWRWQVVENDYVVHRNIAADRKYAINDGEGLMHEDHCNSDLRDSVLQGNKGNSYLSIYKCGTIDGFLVAENDVSTPGDIADIYVVADRNSGRQPCRNVEIVDNVTRSNGILIAGDPAAKNVVRGNRHVGKGGVITNQAKAKLSGNEGYEVA